MLASPVASCQISWAFSSHLISLIFSQPIHVSFYPERNKMWNSPYTQTQGTIYHSMAKKKKPHTYTHRQKTPTHCLMFIKRISKSAEINLRTCHQLEVQKSRQQWADFHLPHRQCSAGMARRCMQCKLSLASAPCMAVLRFQWGQLE